MFTNRSLDSILDQLMLLSWLQHHRILMTQPYIRHLVNPTNQPLIGEASTPLKWPNPIKHQPSLGSSSQDLLSLGQSRIVPCISRINHSLTSVASDLYLMVNRSPGDTSLGRPKVCTTDAHLYDLNCMTRMSRHDPWSLNIGISLQLRKAWLDPYNG